MTAAEFAALDALIGLALTEDLGEAGDVTSRATIPAGQTGRAAVVARAPGVLAGIEAAARVAERVDPALRFEPRLADGASLDKGDVIATLAGPMRSLLAAERTLLNFLQRLSGVATLTRQYVEAVAGLKVEILDTRKTTPGWRLLEKAAVRAGGGTNHRIGLHDAILIKDNHLAGVRSAEREGRSEIEVAIARCRAAYPTLPVEVEVDSLDQFDVALACGPAIVLLDNMTTDHMREAVRRRAALAPATLLEASGGVNLETIRGIAETGVDRISVGALTHSAKALDIALDYQE
ncbi:MAG TPA: carboxylating nicotinate-nucleotide diphosphorylase [Gemmataceae bacterium]|nr:carboxylating nicotinate-nucleotide diphosphorylase [Gemmataceae bacterium]